MSIANTHSNWGTAAQAPVGNWELGRAPATSTAVNTANHIVQSSLLLRKGHFPGAQLREKLMPQNMFLAIICIHNFKAFEPSLSHLACSASFYFLPCSQTALLSVPSAHTVLNLNLFILLSNWYPSPSLTRLNHHYH